MYKEVHAETLFFVDGAAPAEVCSDVGVGAEQGENDAGYDGAADKRYDDEAGREEHGAGDSQRPTAARKLLGLVAEPRTRVGFWKISNVDSQCLPSPPDAESMLRPAHTYFQTCAEQNTLQTKKTVTPPPFGRYGKIHRGPVAQGQSGRLITDWFQVRIRGLPPSPHDDLRNTYPGIPAGQDAGRDGHCRVEFAPHTRWSFARDVVVRRNWSEDGKQVQEALIIRRDPGMRVWLKRP